MTILALNRKVTHNYQIHERFEAGLVLEGWEVKGIMAGTVQLVDSHVVIKNGEAWLFNCHIKPQANVDANKVNPRRSRKLLLHSKELDKLIVKQKQSGIALVVLNLHRTKGKIKAEIATAKGKKLFDKRRHIKERDLSRAQNKFRV